MNFFPDFKTVVTFGGFQITWYALFILGGALLAYFLSLKAFKKKGYDVEIFENFFFYMLPIAIIGARLYYVIFEWQQYQGDLIRIFFIWEGGLAIHGGIIAAVIFGFFYFKKLNINALYVMDVAFPFLMIAQAIGRIGNFMNQEAYGSIVTSAFYNGWPSFIKDHMFIDGNFREPTFLYESVGNIIGFIIIYFIFKKHGAKKRGDVAFAYLAWYGLIRLLIEGLRSDALLFLGIRVAQVVSIIFVLVGICGILGLFDHYLKKYWPFNKQKPVIIFDVDGTLIDTRELIYNSFRHTFKSMDSDVQLNEELLATFMGPSLNDTFKKYFNEADAKKAFDIYRAYNIENHDAMVKEMPHALAVVKQLKVDGYDIGVLSNKRRDVVEMGLKKCGFDGLFKEVMCFDDGIMPKPSAEGIIKIVTKMGRSLNDVVYIGDSSIDILAAKNMGAYSIAYAYDELGVNELAKTKPCATIHEMDEILDIVKEEKAWIDVTI